MTLLERFVIDHIDALERAFGRDVRGATITDAVSSPCSDWLHCSGATQWVGITGWTERWPTTVGAFWSAESGWIYPA